jgi:DNA gyrase/topoisomerase IV subunit B
MADSNTPKKDWKRLNDFQHARLRNEMYFGSRDLHHQTVLGYGPKGALYGEETWVPAVFTAFREILDNALDECITHGHGDTVRVTYDPETMVASVEDNGRGVPINWDEEEQNYAATVLLSSVKAGRNFEERGNSRGMNGIGASVVNLCSEYFVLDINRGGQNFNQRFSESETDHVIEEPIIMPSAAKGTGTRVEFKLSAKVFPKLVLPEAFVRARVYEIALCYPRLKVFYNGERVVTKGTVERSLFPNHKPVSFTVKEPGFVSEFWLVPGFMGDGSEMAYGLVNAIPTFNGGTHIDSFKRYFFSGLLDALASTSKKKRLTPNRSDIADGMLCFNITEMDGASFDSQNKTRLINETCAASVKKALDDPEFFKRVIKNNPEWIESIYARCAERTQKKDSAEASKLAKKTLREKVDKLQDATGRDRQKCVIFLGEGDSAISGITDARNPEIHGGLPLRGKVLNVHGKSIKTILENQALCQIMGSIGLVPGQKANRATLRYGAVYITTDADEDGKNIAALLVNFFYTLWPELFVDPKRPFLYVFDTPLIIAVRGKTRKYWYNENYEDFDPEAHKGWDVTRAKGLAALKREDWKHVLANPKVQPIVDDGELKAALDLLFNESRADARKDFIGM